MKKLVVGLTEHQFRRLAIVAALLQAKPEHVLLGLTFGELDTFGERWSDAEDYLDGIVTDYGERRRAFSPQLGSRDQPIEETAPACRLRLAKRVVDDDEEFVTVTLQSPGTPDDEIEIPVEVWELAQTLAAALGQSMDEFIEETLAKFFERKRRR